MERKVALKQKPHEDYEQFSGIPFDQAFEIVNETGLQIGLIFLSDLTDGTVYIEWLEIMTCFRGYHYLGKILMKIREMNSGKKIQLESSDENLPKYLHYGCEQVGFDECTEMHILEY